MNNGELVFYLVLVSMNLVIAYYWAMYGFFEVTLDPQRSKNPMLAAFIGIVAGIVAGYMQRAGLLKLEVITQSNINMACVYLFTPPLVFMGLIRLLLSSKGTPEYNRARSATQFWTRRNLKLGHILTEEAELLRNFPRAIRALRYFDRAIAIQKKGTKPSSTSRFEFSVVDRETDYNGFYDSNCPACRFSLKVPDSAVGESGQCGMCGAFVTAKRIGDTIYVSAFGKAKNRRVLTAGNKRNIATALGEKAVLFRMMNLFDEAKEVLEEALKLVEQALSENQSHKETLALKSLIIFRAAELEHVSGSKAKAKELYNQCLAIDESIGDTRERELIIGLRDSL